MSSGTRVPLDTAYKVALQVRDRIKPHVARLELAGSIRRQKEKVGDIELVGEPNMAEDLFGNTTPDLGPLRKELEDMGEVTSKPTALRQIKVADILGSGIKLDLYLVHPPAQWGIIHLIRTGSARFSTAVMSELREHGYRSLDGRVVDMSDGSTIDTPDEESVFELIGWKYRSPRLRL